MDRHSSSHPDARRPVSAGRPGQPVGPGRRPALALLATVLAYGALAACTADSGEDENTTTNALTLGQACLAFEAAAPPGIDLDIQNQLRENPRRWKHYRTALGNFYWSTDVPLRYIEMDYLDREDNPERTEVWQAISAYHQVIEDMRGDHFLWDTKQTPESYPRWEDGVRALREAGNDVEAACAAEGATVNIVTKPGLLFFEEAPLYPPD